MASLKHLQVLGICRVQIDGKDGWKGIERLQGLQKLNLSCKTPITSLALRSIGNLPNLRDLTLSSVKWVDASGLDALADLKQLRTLHLASLNKGVSPAVFRKLQKLEELIMWDQPLAPGTMNAIAELPHIRRLDVFFGPHPTGGVWSPAWPKTLEELNLEISSEAKLKTESMQDMTNLRKLILRVPGGHSVLADVGRLQCLRELVLTTGPVGKSNALDLRVFKGLRSLQVLDMSWCNLSQGLRLPDCLDELKTLYVGDAGLGDSWFLEFRGMGKLRTLYLGLGPVSYCRPTRFGGYDSLAEALEAQDGDAITDAGIVCLGRWPAIEELSLSHTLITGSGLKSLARLPLLRKLDLSNTWIDDVGLSNLVGLQCLEELNLEDTKITDAGLTHLVSLKSLRRLYLSSTQITDAGTKTLAQIKTLEELDLGYMENVTDEAVKQLRVALPNTRVRCCD
ncbi:MAG: hypothetical protein HN350_18990 [Phycisphaerales bacterium]|nr:hypothetical protein [Phycisphaerales bacterium]